MKKNLYIIFCLFAYLCDAQTSTLSSCKGADWNWLDFSQNNWIANTATHGTNVYIGSPFDPNNPSAGIEVFDQINRAEDYWPDGGWRLVQKDFGCSGAVEWPWFMLYNKYSGSLRLFVWTSAKTMENGAVVTVEWGANSAKTLLIPQNINGLFASQYAKTNLLMGEQILYYSSNFIQSNWMMMDITTMFDPSIVKGSIGDCAKSYKLSIKMRAVVKQIVDLKGSFDFYTKPDLSVIGAKTTETVDSVNTSFRNLAINTNSYLQKVPNKDAMKKSIDKAKDGLEKASDGVFKYSDSDFGYKLSQSLCQLSNDIGSEESGFRKFLTGVSGVAGAASSIITTGLAVFDFFTGKSTKKEAKPSNPSPVIPMPTMSNGQIKLIGTITTDIPKGEISLQLPGTKVNTSAAGAPYYSAPLGVIAMEKEPQMTKNSIRIAGIDAETKLAYKQNTAYVLESFCNDYNLDKYFGSFPCYEGIYNGYSNEFYKSIRIDAAPTFVINQFANVKVIEAKCALVGRLSSSNGTPVYSLEPENIPNPDLPIVGGYAKNKIWYNRLARYLSEGVYHLSKVNADNSAEFQTPFIPLEKIVNTSFTVPSQTEVFLKVLFTLEPVDAEADKTPVFMVQTYKLNEPAETMPSYCFPFTNQQLVDYVPKTHNAYHVPSDGQPKINLNLNKMYIKYRDNGRIGSLAYIYNNPRCLGVYDGCARFASLKPSITPQALSSFSTTNASFINKNVAYEFNNTNINTKDLYPNFRTPIIANGQIAANQDVRYETNSYIQLNAGFTTAGSTSFTAIVNDNLTIATSAVNAGTTPLSSMISTRDCQCDGATLKSYQEADIYAETTAVDISKSDSVQLSIRPNPAHSTIYIEANATGVLHIFNSLGLEIKTIEIQASVSEIDICQLSNGLYFAVLQTANSNNRYQFIKE